MFFRKSMIAAAFAAGLTAAASAGQAQTITIGLGTEPTSIDPHYHNLGPNNQISQHIFSRLIVPMQNIFRPCLRKQQGPYNR